MSTITNAEVQLDFWDYWEPKVDPRSLTPQEMVREYAKTSEQKPDPSLYEDLVSEEYLEWAGAMMEDSEVNRLKEAADLVYVVYGWAEANGYDLDMAMLRVHDNNMGRMYQADGTIKRREDGKIIKNKDYPKVELGDLV